MPPRPAAAHSLGRWFVGAYHGDGETGYALRGAAYGSDYPGLYFLYIHESTAAWERNGFRCVYRP